MLLTIGACAPTTTPNAIRGAADEGTSDPQSIREGVALDTHSDLNAVIIVPPTAAYDISTLGPTTRTISVRLTNEGDHPIDIAGVDTVFSVTRNGVSFTFPAHPRHAESKHVPFWLPPGEPFSRPLHSGRTRTTFVPHLQVACLSPMFR